MTDFISSLNQLLELYNERSQLHKIMLKQQDHKSMMEAAEIESKIDRIVNKCHYFKSKLSPTDKIQYKSNIEQFNDIANKLLWNKFPIMTTSLDFTRDELMKYFKIGKDQTFKKSLHPYCLSLYRQYDKTCHDCAVSLHLPLINPESHEFRPGDLSILFHYFRKIITNKQISDNDICNYIDDMLKICEELVECLAYRFIQYSQCMQPIYTSEHHQELQLGDKEHFDFEQFICFELVFFFETIAKCIERHCDKEDVQEKYEKILYLYSETFQTCETTIRQELNLTYKNNEYISYEGMIKKSLIYQEILQNRLQPTYVLDAQIESLKYIIKMYQKLNESKITVHFFLTTSYEKVKSQLVFEDISQILEHLIKSLYPINIEHKILLEIQQKMVPFYQEISKHSKNIDDHYEEINDKFKNLIKEKINVGQYEFNGWFITTNNIVYQQIFQNKYIYMNNRKLIIICYDQLKEIQSKRIEQKRLILKEYHLDIDKEKIHPNKYNFNHQLLDFVSNKFYKMKPYNYIEHMNEIYDMLKSKELRLLYQIDPKNYIKKLREKSNITTEDKIKRKSSRKSCYKKQNQYKKILLNKK